MSLAVGLDEGLVAELAAIVGPDRVRTDAGAPLARTRASAPFPVPSLARAPPAGGRAAAHHRRGVRDPRAREPATCARRCARRWHRTHRRCGPRARWHLARHEGFRSDLRDRPPSAHRHGWGGGQHAQAQRGARAVRPVLPRRSGLVPDEPHRRQDRHERLVAHRRSLRPHPRSRLELRVRPRGRTRGADRRRRPAQPIRSRAPSREPRSSRPDDPKGTRSHSGCPWRERSASVPSRSCVAGASPAGASRRCSSWLLWSASRVLGVPCVVRTTKVA